jgi:hypothetical protein
MLPIWEPKHCLPTNECMHPCPPPPIHTPTHTQSFPKNCLISISCTHHLIINLFYHLRLPFSNMWHYVSWQTSADHRSNCLTLTDWYTCTRLHGVTSHKTVVSTSLASEPPIYHTYDYYNYYHILKFLHIFNQFTVHIIITWLSPFFEVHVEHWNKFISSSR